MILIMIFMLILIEQLIIKWETEETDVSLKQLSLHTFPLIKGLHGFLLFPQLMSCLAVAARLFRLLLIDVLLQCVAPDRVADVGPAEDWATVAPENKNTHTLCLIW